MAESRPQLSTVEQRVLGALLEKQRTVPASYPLTLNSLRSACNQTSSRDPVTNYADALLQTTLKELKERELVRTVWTGAGSRVIKYHQRLEEQLGLDRSELALIAVLLLRGPQTPSELRTRAERLHAFADRAAVEATLHALAELEEPLVVELERKAGQQDRRWAHLLGPLPESVAPPTAPTIDRDVVIAEGVSARNARVVASYDAAAAGYARELSNELAHKPFDRWLLDRIAALADGGEVADVGTGPGHVAAHLAAAGASVVGVDLSPAMIDQARELFPELEWQVGDLTDLLRPRAAAGWSAITAWYAFVHLATSELPEAIAGLSRVLIPGGYLGFALHVGDEIKHLDEFFGAAVDLDFVQHNASDVVDAATAAGLVEVEWYLRSPLPDVEAATNRIYVLGRRPS